MKKITEADIVKVLDSIDTDQLGEIMVDKAEYLQSNLSDDWRKNIILFEITLEDLVKENFYDMKELKSIEYGDWDSLKDLVSESEVERMKNQFVEDLAYKATMGFSEPIEYSLIYSSFLYCNGEFVWSGTA